MASKKDSSVARFVDEDEDEEDDGDYNEYDDDDDEDEEEIYDDEDDDEEDEDDENNNNVTPFAILNGYLQMNDEGRVIYYGLWRMNTESNDGDTSKKKRFRLKSRKSFRHNNGNNSNGDDSFDLTCPCSIHNKSRRIIIFDGFFVDPKGMKIREHNVEISFLSSSMTKTTSSDNLKNTAKFEVNGQGANEFGPFFLNGTYYAPNDDNNNNGKTPVYPLELRKWYDDSQASNKPSINSRKRARQDHDDDDENDGENVDYELAGLYEEACMSVDELKRRYQISQKHNKHNFDTTTNGSKDNEFHKKNNDDDDDSKKRYKRTGLLDDDNEDDDDDDGGCGF